MEKKILYLDCSSGISGDMTLAALLDLGIDKDDFIRELKKLDFGGYELDIKKITHNSIQMMDVDVILDSEKKERAGRDHEHDNSHVHSHAHGHAHEHLDHREPEHGHEHDYDAGHVAGHDHSHELPTHCDHEHNHEYERDHGHDAGSHNAGHDHVHTGHDHSHADHIHRNLQMVTDIIDASTITDNAKAIGKKIFTEIAVAEGKVHGKPLDEVHFHEVGAVDSLVDIMGTAICLDILGADEIYASPLHEGSGTVMCQHGILPVPVPAVTAMLSGSGIPVIQEDSDTELITPTGAGIAKCMVKSFGKMPPMTIERVGYGHGKRDTGLFGALRAFLGTPYENL